MSATHISWRCGGCCCGCLSVEGRSLRITCSKKVLCKLKALPEAEGCCVGQSTCSQEVITLATDAEEERPVMQFQQLASAAGVAAAVVAVCTWKSAAFAIYLVKQSPWQEAPMLLVCCISC